MLLSRARNRVDAPTDKRLPSMMFCTALRDLHLRTARSPDMFRSSSFIIESPMRREPAPRLRLCDLDHTNVKTNEYRTNRVPFGPIELLY